MTQPKTQEILNSVVFKPPVGFLRAGSIDTQPLISAEGACWKGCVRSNKE
jgi:hypothetical protein